MRFCPLDHSTSFTWLQSSGILFCGSRECHGLVVVFAGPPRPPQMRTSTSTSRRSGRLALARRLSVQARQHLGGRDVARRGSSLVVPFFSSFILSFCPSSLFSLSFGLHRPSLILLSTTLVFALFALGALGLLHAVSAQTRFIDYSCPANGGALLNIDASREFFISSGVASQAECDARCTGECFLSSFFPNQGSNPFCILDFSGSSSTSYGCCNRVRLQSPWRA